MKSFSLPGRGLKTVGCSAFVALLMGVASHAHAQNSYSTTFDNDVPNSTLSGQDGWTDNDNNQPDSVGVVGSYSSSSTDYLASVGGAFVSDRTAAPSTSPVYLAHGFTPVGTTYSFDVDFAITASTTAYPNENSFAFTFMGAAGNLFSIDFVPNGNTNTEATADAIRYSIYSNPVTNTFTQTSTGDGTVLNSRYHLSLTVNTVANTLTFSITDETPTGTMSATPNFTSAAIPLSAADALNPVTSFAATYLVAPNTTPGSNALFFDNVVAVPEPSTWAMMGLGTLGLVLSFRRKSKA